MAERVLGVDIGGSGIKANLVNVTTGEILSDRFRVDTPRPATTDAVAAVVGQMADHFGASGRIGCALPTVVRHGVAVSAANIDDSWIGTDAASLFERATGLDVVVLNDADAAGLAEMNYGVGQQRNGVVVVITFGTGIGSAVFTHGVLVPNTELGHIELNGFSPVEEWAAASVRDREGLSWDEWGDRVNAYLNHIGRILTPDLVIVGGGASKVFDEFSDRIDVDFEVVAAEFRNNAGIVGAALAATSQ